MAFAYFILLFIPSGTMRPASTFGWTPRRKHRPVGNFVTTVGVSCSCASVSPTRTLALGMKMSEL